MPTTDDPRWHHPETWPEEWADDPDEEPAPSDWPEELLELDLRRRSFVLHYLTNGHNATEAAESAGYDCVDRMAYTRRGWKVLQQAPVKAAIEALWAKTAISPAEVKSVLADHVRGTFDDFLADDDPERVDLIKARQRGKLHLVRKLKSRTTTRGEGDKAETVSEVQIELYDAQSAADKLLRAAGEYKDSLAISGGLSIEDALAAARAAAGADKGRAFEEEGEEG